MKEYRKYDSRHLIIQPPGCGGNYLTEWLNTNIFDNQIAGTLHHNNEYRSIPNDDVSCLHLHEYFKLDNGAIKYSHNRYKQILQQARNQSIVVIMPGSLAGMVDCLALYKKWTRDGNDNTFNYVKNQAQLGFPNHPGHHKQLDHYERFMDRLENANVDYLRVSYKDIFVNNDTAELACYFGLWDMDFQDYIDHNNDIIEHLKSNLS